MDITVVLCTYNRCQSLIKALDSIAASTLPDPVKWEVLVVDNNSRDQTREVVEDFCRRQPGRFRYLFEPLPGRSNALNSGVRKAYGEILAFTDDDVIVEPNWLRDLTSALESGEWSGAGGRTLPEKNFSPPSWLSLEDGRHPLAPLGVCDLGPEPGELTEAPIGNNMAVRRVVLEKYDGFRTDLGASPGGMIGGEDTEFGQRLLDAGERLRYEPSAVIYHSVPPKRLCKKYFLTWSFGSGRACIRFLGIPHDTKWFIGGIPIYLFRRLAVWTLRWMVAFIPSRRFSCKRKVWGIVGEIKECYRLSRKD